MDTPPHEGLDEGRARWQEAYDASTLRDADFETMSGIPLEPVYGPEPTGPTGPGGAAPGLARRPGPPYTRGPYASMYRSKLWTMRLFAGFGTAEDTNVASASSCGPGAAGCRSPSTFPP
jgi:methylmalonyl-CoA mutase N-terminal domain/subunit